MFLNLFTLETFLNLRYMSITMSKLHKTLATCNHSVDTKPKSASWRYTIKANQKLFHEEQGRAIQNNAADVETKNMTTKTRILLCHAWLGGNKSQMCKTYTSVLWHHDLHTLLRVSGIWAVSEEKASPWLAHGEDWIILLGEQRLLSALSERRPVTDGHLHCLSWLLSSSISQIPYLHVSLLNDGSQEEQTANEITATTSPSLSFYFHLARSHFFLPLHFLSVNVWLALMTIQFSVHELASHRQKEKKHCSSKHSGQRMRSWFSYGVYRAKTNSICSSGTN